MTRAELPVPLLVGVAVAVAVLANAAQFINLEFESNGPYEAIRTKTGHDPASLVEEHFTSTREEFLLTTRLREHATGARVIVRSGTGLLSEQLLGLGLAGSVRRVDEVDQVDVVTASSLDDFIVAEGEDEFVGPWALVVDDGPVEVVVEVAGPTRTYLVDARVLDRLGVGGAR